MYSLQKIMFINVIVILYERMEWRPIGKGVIVMWRVLCIIIAHVVSTNPSVFITNERGHLEIIMCIIM